MIEYTTGNIFDADVEALVNPVNCVGVMGQGLALWFRNKFPTNYMLYRKACKEDKVELGNIFVTRARHKGKIIYIINFPTKGHWREKSKLENIAKGLDSLALYLEQCNIESVAVPALGCGLGGLDWKDVKALFDDEESAINEVGTYRRVVVYEPNSYITTRIH